MYSTDQAQRSPALAAILNFFIWGTGYAYAGIPRFRGIPWVGLTVVLALYSVVTYVLGRVGLFLACSSYYYGYCASIGVNGAAIIGAMLPLIIIGGYLSYDVYRQVGAVGFVGGPAAASSRPGAAATRCPSCGSAMAQGDRFCEQCGWSPTGTPPPQTPTTATQAATVPTSFVPCGRCGTPNKPGSHFCRGCGYKLA